MKSRIYIPSRSRPTAQRTFAQFERKWALDNITIVVPPKQYKEYQRANPGVEIEICKTKGIGNVRQFILDNATSDSVMMLDDDMYFYHRVKKGEVKLATNTAEDNMQMIDFMHGLLDKGYAHVGIGARPEASHHLCSYRTCTRINNCHLFDVAQFRSSGAVFNRLKVMEDFDVILTMLKAGYRNAVTLDYVWNQTGSNQPGGCSDYRTAEVQAAAAHALAKLHPGVVKVIEKDVIGKSSWDGMKTRTDVRIQWRKAYTGKPLKHWDVERGSTRA